MKKKIGNKVHELKCWMPYFEAIYTYIKLFEIRKNDRDYKIGDSLILKEWDDIMLRYTGRECERLITYILEDAPLFGLQKGFVILSIK